MNKQSIPFLDLVTPHRELESELVDVFRNALHTAGFIGGPMVQRFESDFAAFCDVSHSVGVNSGTDALRFAIAAAGVKPGDVVITVSHTFVATTEAITQVGAIPEFVDIDERTYTMDPAKLQEFVDKSCSRDSSGNLVSKRNGRRVTAVIPVHLYGQMADMDPILEIANRHHLVVVEDACQAHGAQYFSTRQDRWFKAGSMGQAAAFSFYPGKNLGACGEGGAITTNDEAIATTCRMLRDHGQSQKYYHAMEGYNGRLDAIQAGILTVKLKHLEDWNRQRRHAADSYAALLGSCAEVVLPVESANCKSVYHLYVVRVTERNEVQKALQDQGIGTGIHYPVPVHVQQAYGYLNYSASDFPVTSKVASQILSLPMYPTITTEQQQRVVRELIAASKPRVLAQSVTTN